MCNSYQPRPNGAHPPDLAPELGHANYWAQRERSRESRLWIAIEGPKGGVQMGAVPPVSLLERVRVKHYSIRTEQAYCDWIRRFVIFHGKRHPSALGAPESRRS
jgi:hypothetical protein